MKIQPKHLIILGLAVAIHLLILLPFTYPIFGLPSFAQTSKVSSQKTLTVELIQPEPISKSSQPATERKQADDIEFNHTNNLADTLDSLDINKATQPNLLKGLEGIQKESFDNAQQDVPLDKGILENVFSNQTQEQLIQAEKAQQSYQEIQTEEIEYAITEDSDGTRYVNIKGVCWRIPPPGTEEPWTIVYAGCSGQTKTFNIEINIGLDVLGPDSPLAID